MPDLVARTSARRSWSTFAKAAPAVATSRGLGGLSRLTSDSGGFTGYGQVTVPDAANQAMADQGMQTGGPFSPGRPIQQFAPWGMDPRSWDFPVGYNITTRPRAQQGRVSFETMKAFVDAWDVLRLCINHIQRDIRSMDWSIGPMAGLEEDVTDQVKQATKIMAKPDGIKPFDAWQWELLEDVLRYDAGTLYRLRNRAGQVQALEVVSGPTVGPLIDYYGRQPQGDAPAYVQYINGMPWQWLRSDALIYQPFAPQPESVYGLPVAEWLMLTGNTDLRFQWHFLLYFTEGTIPEGFMEAPPEMSDPENIVKFQAAYDAVMEGDQAQKHRMRWVPAGSKPSFPATKNFDPNFPLYLMRKTCAACGITPSDLGFTDAVNKASADSQMDVQFRIGTMPLVSYLRGLYTSYLQEDRGLPVEFNFNTGREKEDRLQEAQAMDAYVKMGALSPDEVRRDILGLPIDVENPAPRFIFSSRAGAIPLKSIVEIAGQIDPATAAPEPGSVDTIETAGQYVAPTGVVPQPDDVRTKTAASKTPGQDPMTDATTRAPQGGPKVASAGNEQAAEGVGGAGPVAKAGGPRAAGLAVKANDTGRVLMLQRALDPNDPAAGAWEFPGGHVEEGEDALGAARREWSEETGAELPQGQVSAAWTSPDGVYQGFVYVIGHEAELDINLDHEDRGVLNPDDPDGDAIEVVAWWSPADAHAMPGLRPECSSTDWGALATASLVAKSKTARWRQRKKAARREVAAAGPPFAKAAERPLESRPLHAQLSAAEDHYAERLRQVLATTPIDDLAGRWLSEQPVAKALAKDALDAALAFLRRIGLSLPGLADILRAIYRDGWQLGGGAGQQAARDAGFEIAPPTTTLDWSTWKPGSPAAAEQAKGLADLLDKAGVVIQGIDETTMERLASILAEGAAAGDSVGTIGRALREFIDDPARAEAIAHTELARAVSAASLDVYAQNGIGGKSWLTFNPCPLCARNEAAGVIPRTQAFPSGDQAPPGHPKCKCSVVPEQAPAEAS